MEFQPSRPWLWTAEANQSRSQRWFFSLLSSPLCVCEGGARHTPSERMTHSRGSRTWSCISYLSWHCLLPPLSKFNKTRRHESSLLDTCGTSGITLTDASCGRPAAVSSSTAATFCSDVGSSEEWQLLGWATTAETNEPACLLNWSRETESK